MNCKELSYRLNQFMIMILPNLHLRMSRSSLADQGIYLTENIRSMRARYQHRVRSSRRHGPSNLIWHRLHSGKDREGILTEKEQMRYAKPGGEKARHVIRHGWLLYVQTTRHI